MAVQSLESELQEKIDELKTFVNSLQVGRQQRTELYERIREKKCIKCMDSLSLSKQQQVKLAGYVKEAYRLYDAAYRDAANCPAVSEWMREPTDVVLSIWETLKVD
jgi:hypothetical protein